MPNFAPNSIIYLGNVPFDNSYRHTMTFANATEQAAYFSSVCNRALDNSSYTYVRMNNSIRVPFNAEELYTYDYCMYKNANYGNKWFYAFIVGVNYVNENMTEIILELDVMQTWYFDYTLVQGFVEREHVDDDSVGLHINSEPPMDLQYKIEVGNLKKDFPAYVVLLVSAFPNYKYDMPYDISATYTAKIGEENYSKIINDDGNNAISGAIIQRQYSACIPLLYDLRNPASVKTLKNDIQLYNICGCADAIIDMFTIPADSVGSNWMSTNKVFFNDDERNGYMIVSPSISVLKEAECFLERDNGVASSPPIVRAKVPDNVDVYKIAELVQWDSPFNYESFAYTPKNNKLYCYPYCYVETGDFTGRKTEYRFEYFNNYIEQSGQLYKYVAFDVQEPINSEGTGYITPRDYNGGNTYGLLTESINYMPFTFSYTNKLPWTYSIYQNWAAQNQLVNELAVIGGLATTAVAVMPGIGAAAKVLGAGAGLSGAAAAEKVAEKGTPLQAFKKEANTVGMGIGAGSIAGVIGNYDRMSRMPNEARGNTAGNSKIQCGYQGYYVAKYYLRYEFAKIVDDFFSMYGYAVDRVKIPNRTGRLSWNYVKMQNSCHRGNVPADQMDIINSIYDKGITFWHTSDIGNYSLDNSIVS